MNTERPDNLFEQVSYDLNKFRERRVSDRRFQVRSTADRRIGRSDDMQEAEEQLQVETQSTLPATGADSAAH